MTTVYDKQGKPVELPPEQAAAAVASGDYGVPKDADVPVFSPDGTLATVKGAELHTALGEGSQLASEQDVTKAKLERKYGGLGGGAAAAGLEGLSTLTLGLSDVAGGAIGGEGYREARKGYREANPLATLGGGIAGAVAPILLSGGAAAPEEAALAGGRLLGEGAEGASLIGSAARTGARALAAPTAAVSRAGGAVEGAVAKLIGADESTSLVSALARKAIAKGAGAATEGALYGVGQQLGEDALGDPDANGEKLYASGLHGALLGLGAGVGLTALGEVSSAVLGRAMPKLSGMAEEQAVRAIEPHANGARELERLAGGAKAAGRQMLEDGIVRTGDSVEDIAPRISAAKEAAGAKVGAIYDAADQAGIKGPSIKDVTARLEREVLPDLEKLPSLNRGAISAVRDAIADIHAFAGIPDEATALANGVDRAAVLENKALTFREAQEIKSTLGKRINWKKSPFPTTEDKANDALKDVYGILSKEIDAAGEHAAKALGGSFAEQLREANRTYQTYTTLDRVAQNALRLKEGRNIAAPSTKGFGMAAMAGMLAHGSGGPASLATGAAAALANHVFKERGASTTAVLLDKLSALRGIERASKAVDREVDRGVAGILREPGRASPRVRPLPDERQPYRAHAEAALRAGTNLTAHAGIAASAAAPLAPHAPGVAKAFQSTATRAAQYLASKVPHRNAPPTIMPHLDEPRVSEADKEQFLRVSHAVHDPVSVLEDMAQGRATRAQIDAVKAVYPKLYEQLQQTIQERLSARTDPLAYEQRKQLALLFGAAADPAFDPAFVARMQKDFAGGSGPGSGGGAPKGSAPKRQFKDTADRIKLAGM